MPSAGLPELGPALVHPLSVSMQSWANSAMSLSYPLSELEKEREPGKPLSLQTVRVCGFRGTGGRRTGRCGQSQPRPSPTFKETLTGAGSTI